MYQQKKNTRKVNHCLTRLIIALHQQGYEIDFCLAPDNAGLITATTHDPVIERYFISKIVQGYDEISGRFKYLHAIETFCGLKGLLLSHTILFHKEACATAQPLPTAKARLFPYQVPVYTNSLNQSL